MNIQFKDKMGSRSGGIELELSSYPSYKLILCSEWYDSDVQLPAGPEMIWTIEMKEGKLRVWCDDIVVLQDISPSDETCNNDLYKSGSWNRYWSLGKDVIRFSGIDTASQSYRTKPPPSELGTHI